MVTSLNQGKPAREAGYEMIQYISTRLVMSGTANLPVLKVGTISAGSVVIGISNTVVTVIAGGTPVLGLGSVAAGGTVPAVGGSGNVNIVMSEAVGSEWIMPLASQAVLTVDTDFYVGTSGGATSGDTIVAIYFIKPVA
jgi:hypothetical protein